jgi:hypothetical protein
MKHKNAHRSNEPDLHRVTVGYSHSKQSFYLGVVHPNKPTVLKSNRDCTREIYAALFAWVDDFYADSDVQANGDILLVSSHKHQMTLRIELVESDQLKDARKKKFNPEEKETEEEPPHK